MWLLRRSVSKRVKKYKNIHKVHNGIEALNEALDYLPSMRIQFQVLANFLARVDLPTP